VIQDAFPDASQLGQLLTLSAQTLAMSIPERWGWAGICFPSQQRITLLPGGFWTTSIGGATAVLVFTRFLLLVLRAVPEPIWALIFLFVLFPGFYQERSRLLSHNLGIMGRLMAEVTENLDAPLRALKAVGASGSQVLYGVLPCTLPFLPHPSPLGSLHSSNSDCGFVGAGGLGRLTEQLSSFDCRGVVITLICFIGPPSGRPGQCFAAGVT